MKLKSDDAGSLTCEMAREMVQERLDGELTADLHPALHAHLDRCTGCREYQVEMKEICTVLQSIPTLSLPEQALDEVWSRTVDAGGWSLASRLRLSASRRPVWAMAAAAMVLLAVVGWFGIDHRGSIERRVGDTAAVHRDHDEELLRAAEDARYVLALTSRALRRSEQAAVQGVLSEQVAPALQRIVIEWPEGAEPGNRRQGV